MGKYLWSLIATVFRKRDFTSLGPLQAVTYTVKVVVSTKWCKIDTLLLHTTNRKYYMAYWFMPFPMTLKVIHLLQDLSDTIRRTFVRHLSRFQLTARRSRGPSATAELLVSFDARTSSHRSIQHGRGKLYEYPPTSHLNGLTDCCFRDGPRPSKAQRPDLAAWLHIRLAGSSSVTPAHLHTTHYVQRWRRQ